MLRPVSFLPFVAAVITIIVVFVVLLQEMNKAALQINKRVDAALEMSIDNKLKLAEIKHRILHPRGFARQDGSDNDVRVELPASAAEDESALNMAAKIFNVLNPNKDLFLDAKERTWPRVLSE